jgi:hypothetical protein
MSSYLSAFDCLLLLPLLPAHRCTGRTNLEHRHRHFLPFRFLLLSYRKGYPYSSGVAGKQTGPDGSDADAAQDL